MKRERYYVQIARLNDPMSRFGYDGWLTHDVHFDRETAEAFARSYETAVLVIDGEDVTEQTVTIARVISANELLDAGGSAALAEAESATRIQIHLREAEAENG